MTDELSEIRRMNMLLDVMKDLRVRNEKIGRPVEHLDVRISDLSEAIERLSDESG